MAYPPYNVEDDDDEYSDESLDTEDSVLPPKIVVTNKNISSLIRSAESSNDLSSTDQHDSTQFNLTAESITPIIKNKNTIIKKSGCTTMNEQPINPNSISEVTPMNNTNTLKTSSTSLSSSSSSPLSSSSSSSPIPSPSLSSSSPRSPVLTLPTKPQINPKKRSRSDSEEKILDSNLLSNPKKRPTLEKDILWKNVREGLITNEYYELDEVDEIGRHCFYGRDYYTKNDNVVVSRIHELFHDVPVKLFMDEKSFHFHFQKAEDVLSFRTTFYVLFQGKVPNKRWMDTLRKELPYVEIEPRWRKPLYFDEGDSKMRGDDNGGGDNSNDDDGDDDDDDDYISSDDDPDAVYTHMFITDNRQEEARIFKITLNHSAVERHPEGHRQHVDRCLAQTSDSMHRQKKKNTGVLQKLTQTEGDNTAMCNIQNNPQKTPTLMDYFIQSPEEQDNEKEVIKTKPGLTSSPIKNDCSSELFYDHFQNHAKLILSNDDSNNDLIQNGNNTNNTCISIHSPFVQCVRWIYNAILNEIFDDASCTLDKFMTKFIEYDEKPEFYDWYEAFTGRIFSMVELSDKLSLELKTILACLQETTFDYFDMSQLNGSNDNVIREFLNKKQRTGHNVRCMVSGKILQNHQSYMGVIVRPYTSCSNLASKNIHFKNNAKYGATFWHAKCRCYCGFVHKNFVPILHSLHRALNFHRLFIYDMYRSLFTVKKNQPQYFQRYVEVYINGISTKTEQWPKSIDFPRKKLKLFRKTLSGLHEALINNIKLMNSSVITLVKFVERA